MGFFWLYLLLGIDSGNYLFSKVSKLSIWEDIEDIIQDIPWFIGFFVWWAPRFFFMLFGVIGWISLFYGFFFWGLVMIVTTKILAVGWTAHFYNIMHPMMEYHQIQWYIQLHDRVIRHRDTSVAKAKKTNIYKSYVREKAKLKTKIEAFIKTNIEKVKSKIKT